MCVIRSLENADHPGLLRMNAANVPAVARLDEAELLRLAAIGDSHRVALDAGRKMLGYVLAFTSGDPYDGGEFRHLMTKLRLPFLYVDQLAIDGSGRRRGIGRALYESLAGLARRRQLGLLCCEVNVNPSNPDSMAFHLHMGFAQIASMTVNDGRTVALMTRELQA